MNLIKKYYNRYLESFRLNKIEEYLKNRELIESYKNLINMEIPIKWRKLFFDDLYNIQLPGFKEKIEKINKDKIKGQKAIDELLEFRASAHYRLRIHTA
jgi:hypothetical protein